MYRRYKAKCNNEIPLGIPPKIPRARTKTNLSLVRCHTRNTQGRNSQQDVMTTQEIDKLVVGNPGLEIGITDDLLKGNLEREYPVNSKVVRIFTSSTFTDTKHERNALMERVYPKLKEFCKGFGYEFQVVDMRWGVRDDASNDHTTTELCLMELQACQKLSTGPNFVTFLSHKYGYCPFPRIIETTEFESIMSAIEDEEKILLLEKWFKKDENAVPSSYILQPISTYLPDFLNGSNKETYKAAKNAWWEIYDKLAKGLIEGATNALSKEEMHKYKMSVTEKELTDGILTADDINKHTFWFYRNITDIDEQPDSYLLSRYKELKGPNEVTSEAQELLNDLKENKLQKKLAESNIEKFNVNWTENAIDPDHNDIHKQYIEDLCVKFESTMKSMIEKAMLESTSTLFKQPLYDELHQQVMFCQKKCENFYGREEIFEKIERYVISRTKTPYVIYGESGSGKTSIMAVTVKKCQEWLDNEAVVVARFIGTTPDSSNIRTLLRSILLQIQAAYDVLPAIDQEHDYEEEYIDMSTASLTDLISMFKYTLTKQLRRNQTKEKPLVLILDSLDQLNHNGNPHDLQWLPEKCAGNVKLILSTLPDNDAVQYEYLPKLKARFGENEKNFLQLTRMNDSDVQGIIQRWLSLRKRKLTPSQMEIIVKAFDDCPIPLYLNLCFEKSSLWASYQALEETTLEKSVQEAIFGLFNRIERKLGSVFVSHSLAYITASRNGLSEAELEDILACDDEVLNDVYQYWVPPVRRLPPLLLVRLRADLQQYLVERESDGLKVIYWYHRQFISTARERYLMSTDAKSVTQIHKTIAEFFMGIWSNQAKPFLNKQGQKDTNERLVTSQPLMYQDSYNIRKIMEMPIHLMKAKMYKDLENLVLYNIEWLVAKMKATSYYDMVSDFETALEIITPNEMDMESVQYMLNILRLSQSALQYDPCELPGQFLGRSQKGLEHFRKQCLNPTHPAFVPSGLCLETPGSALRHQMSCSNDITGVALTKDDKYAVTCSDDREISVWDVEKGTLIRSVTDGCPDEYQLENVSLCNSDSLIIASSCEHDSSEYLMKSFKFDTGMEIKIPKMPSFTRYFIFGEEKSKAYFYWDHTLSVLDLKSWDYILEPVKNPDNKKQSGSDLGYEMNILSASKNILAFAYEEKTWFLIYDMGKKSFLPKIQVYKNTAKMDDMEELTVSSLAVSSDATWVLASNIMTNDLEFFDTENGSHLKTLKGDPSFFLDKLRLLDMDNWLVCSSSQSVCFWNLDDDVKKLYFKHPLNIDGLAVTSNMKRIVTISGNMLRVWEMTADTLAKVGETDTAKETEKYISIFPFNSSGRYVLIEVKISEQYYWQVYDVVEDRAVKKIKVDSIIRQPYFLNNEQVLVIAKDRMKLVDLKRNEVKHLQGKIPSYGSVCIINDNKNVLSFTKSRKDLKITSIETCKTTHILYTGTDRKLDGSGLAVNRLGTVAATAEELTGSQNTSILVFSLTTHQLLHLLSLSDEINLMTFTESAITDDGKYLAHSHYGHIEHEDSKELTFVLVWDLETGNLLHKLYDKEALEKYNEEKEKHPNDDISPPGHACMVVHEGQKPLYIQGSEDGWIRIFNIITGELEYRIPSVYQHADVSQFLDPPTSVYSTPKYICANFSTDHSIWIYDATTWKPVASFKSENELSMLCHIGDGSMIVGYNEKHNKPLTLQLHDSLSGVPDKKNIDPVLYVFEDKEYEIMLLDPHQESEIDIDDIDTIEQVDTEDEEDEESKNDNDEDSLDDDESFDDEDDDNFNDDDDFNDGDDLA